jgi:hypothetical protein
MEMARPLSDTLIKLAATRMNELRTPNAGGIAPANIARATKILTVIFRRSDWDLIVNRVRSVITSEAIASATAIHLRFSAMCHRARSSDVQKQKNVTTQCVQ